MPSVAPPTPAVAFQHPLLGVVYQHPLMPAVAAGGSAVVAPTTVGAPEYWGDDEYTVFVETLTDASRTSLQWEQEQHENTVMVSATGKGVRTVFHNGE
jgi:hypothetical protein